MEVLIFYFLLLTSDLILTAHVFIRQGAPHHLHRNLVCGHVLYCPAVHL